MSRDFVRSTSEKLLIGLFSFVVFVSCDNGEIKQKDTEAFDNITPLDKEDLLLGSWEAKWETSSDAFSVSEEYNLTMRGKVQFREDGKVKIHAYGYQGCIFLSDTMINELQYILEGDTVSLLADDENFGLPYQILELQQNKVRLVLMEDIALTLTR